MARKQGEDASQESFEGSLGAPFEESPESARESEPGPDDAEDEWQPPTREAWELSQREIQQLQERERASNQRYEDNQRLLQQVLAGAGPGDRGSSTPPREAGPAPVDLSGMPDVVTDRQGFQSWLGETIGRVQHDARASVEQVRERTQREARANQLFEDFCARHPEMRARRPLVESAAIAAGLTGREPEADIFRRTADQIRSWGVPLTEPGAASTREAAAEPARGVVQTGVGGPSGERGARRRRGAEPEPKDFVDQLAGEQTRLGIF